MCVIGLEYNRSIRANVPSKDNDDQWWMVCGYNHDFLVMKDNG